VVCVGVALGLVAALALGRLVESFLFGVTPRDPLTVLSATLVLLGAGATACLFPAIRAGRIDPAEVLRQE
jgi:putative ABC transport system permease protein